MRNLICATMVVLATSVLGTGALAAGDVKHPRQFNWQFDGVFGTFDKPAIQRGFQVYKEVCAACHGVKRVAFRSLQGVGFSEAEVKTLAAEYTVMDGPNDDGEMFERPGRASDKMPSPYPNEQAARAANNGAYPLDLSLIIKARHDGANYVQSLLTGYEDAPAYTCEEVRGDECVKFHRISPQDAAQTVSEQAEAGDEASEDAGVKKGDLFFCAAITHSEEEVDGKTVHTESCTQMNKGLHYNPYFAGGQIAMVQPLRSEGQVEYQDGTVATVEQMSHDVVSFLQWAAEPEMENRKRMGIRVMIFLGFFTVFFYLAKKRIWARVEH